MDKDGDPKARKIINAKKGITSWTGDLLSDLLEPIAEDPKLNEECIASEQLLHNIDQVKAKIEEDEDDTMVLTLDVEAFFDSLEIPPAYR